MAEIKAFSMKPKHQFIYPNEQNELIVLNQEKEGDNYVNLCLSKLTDELYF